MRGGRDDTEAALVVFRDDRGREARVLLALPPEWGSGATDRLRALLAGARESLPGLRAEVRPGFGPDESYRRVTLSPALGLRDPLEQLLEALERAGLRARVANSVPIAPLGLWEPSLSRPPLFHTRAAAHALVRAGALRRAGLQGAGVNVVVVDLGLDGGALSRLRPRGAPAPDLAGGWQARGDAHALRDDPDEWERTPAAPRRLPSARRSWHGTMVARCVLALTPRARVFDLPLLPERLGDVLAWTDEAVAALEAVRRDIRRGAAGGVDGPWVFCNAWGVYDRRLERPGGNRAAVFTADPTHPLNEIVRAMAEDGHHFVFGAGNGGQFEPHPLCGPGDVGPGRSVLGANSSPHALTVGAVRADGMWIGYSSQGPGQKGFLDAARAVAAARAREPLPDRVEKPDLCAPAHFAEDADAAWLSTGTSAACAVAAGAVAALLSEGSPLRGLAPEELAELLRQTARRPPASEGRRAYDIREGRGILDLQAALAEARGAAAAA